MWLHTEDSSTDFTPTSTGMKSPALSLNKSTANFKYISLLILTLSPLFTQQAVSNSLPPAVELPQGYFQRRSRFLGEWLISCNSGYCKVGIYSWAGLRLPLNSIKKFKKTSGLLKNTRAALLVLPEGLPATSSSLQQWIFREQHGDRRSVNTLPAPMFIPEDFLHRTRFLWHGNNPHCVFPSDSRQEISS